MENNNIEIQAVKKSKELVAKFGKETALSVVDEIKQVLELCYPHMSFIGTMHYWNVVKYEINKL